MNEKCRNYIFASKKVISIPQDEYLTPEQIKSLESMFGKLEKVVINGRMAIYTV